MLFGLIGKLAVNQLAEIETECSKVIVTLGFNIWILPRVLES